MIRRERRSARIAASNAYITIPSAASSRIPRTSSPLGRLLRGQVLGALACLATGCLQRFALRSFEIPQRTLDLLPRVQQIASRLLSRFALGTTLSLANVALPAGEVRHARPRILEHRRGFLLAGR